MQVSFDPLQNSIPEGLRDHLQSSKSKADRLRWMALAGANLPNSDQLVLLQLLRSAPRKPLSDQRLRCLVDDESEIGIALQATSKRLKIDLSHALELLCVVFWQSEVAPERNHPRRALPEPVIATVSTPRFALPEPDAKVATAETERMTPPLATTPTRPTRPATPTALPQPAADGDPYLSFFLENAGLFVI